MSNCWAAAPYAKEFVDFFANHEARVFAIWSNGSRTEVFNELVPALKQALECSAGRRVYEVIAVWGAEGLWGPSDLWIDGTAGILAVDGEAYEMLEDELADKVLEISKEEWE